MNELSKYRVRELVQAVSDEIRQDLLKQGVETNACMVYVVWKAFEKAGLIRLKTDGGDFDVLRPQ